MAPNGDTPLKSINIDPSHTGMQRPSAIQRFLKSIYRRPTSISQFIIEEEMPAEYVIRLINQSRIAGYRVIAHNVKNELTTFEFLPPEKQK